MGAPASEPRLPSLLRIVVWLVVAVWCFAAMVYVARWWLMKRTHQRVQELVISGPRFAVVPRPSQASVHRSAAGSDGNLSQASTPALTLPLIGPVLAGDHAAYAALMKEFNELDVFVKRLNSRVNGLISFKAFLAKIGVEGADGMSEQEAAAEFLRRTARFEAFLAQWKQALALGPWDFSGVDIWRLPGPHADESGNMLLVRLATITEKLWAAQAEACWRIGEQSAAWGLWQTLYQNAERAGDAGSVLNTMSQAGLRQRALETVRIGLQLGGFSDEQLAALPGLLGETRVIGAVKQGLDGEKRLREHWMRGLVAPGNPVTEALVHPFNSWTTNFTNRLAISLTTEQQLADNVAVMHHALDRPLRYFDPRTGVLLSPLPARDAAPNPQSQPQSWFEKFYFMYSGDPMGRSVADGLAHTIVRGQTSVDQARLAAALEQHHRTVGHYPESLEAVAAHFTDGLPIDPATGESYRYQRTQEETYLVWGRGVDRLDNQADSRNDVVWAGGRRPALP